MDWRRVETRGRNPSAADNNWRLAPIPQRYGAGYPALKHRRAIKPLPSFKETKGAVSMKKVAVDDIGFLPFYPGGFKQ